MAQQHCFLKQNGKVAQVQYFKQEYAQGSYFPHVKLGTFDKLIVFHPALKRSTGITCLCGGFFVWWFLCIVLGMGTQTVCVPLGIVSQTLCVYDCQERCS